MNLFLKCLHIASRADRLGVTVTRAGLIVVLLWIGGLKAFKYEADGIIPFVANSPTMSFLLKDPGNYKAHKNPEGALVPENRAWHEMNGTYLFAYGLGAVIVLYGLMLCLHPWLPQVAALGSFLVLIMSVVTLSFLITTPECWVPPLAEGLRLGKHYDLPEQEMLNLLQVSTGDSWVVRNWKDVSEWTADTALAVLLKDLKATYNEGLKHNVALPFNALSSTQLFNSMGKEKPAAK